MITDNTDYKYSIKFHDTYFQRHEIIIKKTNSFCLYYYFMINGQDFGYFS